MPRFSFILLTLLSLISLSLSADDRAAQAYCESIAESAASAEERNVQMKDCLDGLSDQEAANDADSCYTEVQMKIEQITAKDPNASIDYDVMMSECLAGAPND